MNTISVENERLEKATSCEFPRDAFISVHDAFTQPQRELDFVLPGLLVGTVGGIVGSGGSGKSFLSMQLAIAVASGCDITNAFPTNSTGRVVYINAEDPSIVITNRLNKLGAYLSEHYRDKTNKNMTVLAWTGRGITLMDADACKTHWIIPVQKQAEGARLLIFDTARRFQLANENDSAAMAQFLAIFEEIALKTGCTILFCHHSSKFAALNGNGDNQAASRGSSVLVDNARWQANVVGMTKEEAKTLKIEEEKRRKYIRVCNAKVNYSVGFEDIWLERAEDSGVLRKANFNSDNGGWTI